MVGIMLFITYAYLNQIGSKPLPLIPYLILMFVFGTVILFFYKLTICIDNEKITVIFGIGFLKKSIKHTEIERIEIYKSSWLTGVGIRLTPKGWLWNVKVGEAILIKHKTNTFLVGTDEASEIITLLKQK